MSTICKFQQTCPIINTFSIWPRHKLVALKESLVCIHWIFRLIARSLMKHPASLPKTPSAETTRGVKCTPAASQYFLFSSSSADDRIAATSLCEYYRASNVTVWGCHTSPSYQRRNTTCVIGFLYHRHSVNSLYTRDARSPIASFI